MTTTRRTRRIINHAAKLLALALVATSCYFPTQYRIDQASGGADVASWCQGPTDLSSADCAMVSASFDLAIDYAAPYRTLSDFTAAGATAVSPSPAGIGSAYALPGCCGSFDSTEPSILLYESADPGARLVGLAWGVDGAEPAGFPGDLDQWTNVSGRWFLSAWVIRGYLNTPDVFAASHPCLATGAVYTSTSSPCFLASHTEDLEVLVTNDDGIGAEGIDALVEGLIATPGISVTVVAPAVNQSGTGDSTTPGGATGAPGATASGYPGTAVDGTPGDSVIYALSQQGLAPDLVVSGINEGQNMGPIIPFSGTVGAAKWGSRTWIPAIATSQGNLADVDPDFDAGVDATLELVEAFRLGEILNDVGTVVNVNTPTCVAGSVRGTVETVPAASLTGRDYFGADCESTTPIGDIFDDVDAMNNGFVGVVEVDSAD